MKKVYVGFSLPKNKKIFAEAIKWYEGIPFSHVYLRMPTPHYGQDLIYHASGTSVNFMGSNRFLSINSVYEEFEVELSDEAYAETMKFAIDKAGVPYGVMQILGIVYANEMSRLLNKKISNPYADGDHSYVCSELVSAIASSLWGIDVSDSLDLVGPKEVYEIFKKRAALHLEASALSDQKGT